MVSNIVEGTGYGSDREFARFVRIARASNNEIAAQLAIASALGARDTGAIAENAVLGRKISALIKRLEGSG